MTKPGSQQHPTIESLKDRVARDPFSRAFLQLAEEYRRQGRFREAIEVCREGLQRHPIYHTARIALGRTHLEAGDLESARRAFAEVLELQPENHLAAKLLAEIQKKTGDPGGAAVTYRAILSYYPDDREVAALLQEALRQGPAPAAAVPSAPPPAPRESPPVLGRSNAAPVPKPAAAVVPAADRPAVGATGPGPSPPVALHPRWAPVPATRPSDPSPDFRPEDLGDAPFAGSRETWGASVDAGSAPWPETSGDAPGESEDDALQTNTLAEVYLRQGLVDRAVEVYRGMLRVDPGNRKAAGRLSELTPGSLAEPASTSVSPEGGPAGAAGTASPAPDAPQVIAVLPVSPAGGDGASRRETIRRLERWLANVGGGATREAPPR